MKRCAYVLMHFGSNIKYLEYELYSILMLKSISKHDIVYMYSIVDTPDVFVKKIKDMKVKTLGFDDTIIYNKSKEFRSIYDRFNLLRISCFVYANLLTEYKKVCIVESDIILYKGFQNVFKLNTPAAYFHHSSKVKSLENFKKIINSKEVLNTCTNKDKSLINGGVLLFEPNKDIFPKFYQLLDVMIQKGCIFPNEAIYLLLYDEIYNIPINYNMRRFTYDPDITIYGRHFDCTIYKPLDIIKDGYVDTVKITSGKESILYFKKKYYDKYHKKISEIIKDTLKKI